MESRGPIIEFSGISLFRKIFPFTKRPSIFEVFSKRKQFEPEGSLFEDFRQSFKYSQTVIKTRIKETLGYNKNFQSSAFMQNKISMFIGQLINMTIDKRNSFLTAL